MNKKTLIGVLLGIVSFTFLLFPFLTHLRIVENVSMEPSFYSEDIVFFGKGKIKRNSIVIIKQPGKGEIIKRVVGIPGDSIVDLVDSLVLLQPDATFETYNIGKGTYTKSIISDGLYYVKGDNTNRSNDSRYFGLVKRENVQGIVYFKVHKNKNSSMQKSSKSF